MNPYLDKHGRTGASSKVVEILPMNFKVEDQTVTVGAASSPFLTNKVIVDTVVKEQRYYFKE